MAYASISGRARTSPKNPRAHAICDRCGFRYNHVDLTWQFDWRGTTVQNIRILVCKRCLDTPQEQLRAITLPADPVPLVHPRVEFFVSEETTTPPTAQVGAPLGLSSPGAMVSNYGVSSTTYGLLVPYLSVTSAGGTTVTVTCSKAHGLATGAQVSVEGLLPAASNAAGMYSIVVTNGTTFTYTTAKAIPAGSLVGTFTRIITVLVGLPYGATTIPVA